MKNKRTPFRQSREGGSENRPEKPVDRDSQATRSRGPRREAPAAQAAPAAPRRKPAPNTGGRANRGTIARDGRPLAEAKPERLQKVLAQAGIGSRREMEEWIAAGRISVNGVTAHLGQGVVPTDKIKIGGRLVNVRFTTTRTPRVVMYHKPEGEIVSRDDPEGRPSVFTALPRIRGGRWIAVGRLDFNTVGPAAVHHLGRTGQQADAPEFGTGPRLCRARARRSDAGSAAAVVGWHRTRGRSGQLLPVCQDAGGEGANHWYRVTLFEGRNREVRRMFEAVGCTVSRLIRVRYGPFSLPPQLKRGRVHELDEAEVKGLLRELDKMIKPAEMPEESA